MKKHTYIYILLASAVVGLSTLFIFAIVDRNDNDSSYRSHFFRDNRTYNPPLPDKASFAGERVPLEICYVRESLEREIMANTFMHSSTLLMFKRAYRWFPVIEPILKRNGVPDDFKFLALAESNLSNVVSSAGAEGFWQFIKPTGIRYGLEITEEVDERYHLEKATEAACRYLQEAKALYGNWTLAAASYNRGMDGLTKALENQRVNNYYDLYLNEETARYVFRIIAMKEVYNNPVKYGFFLREKDLYPQVPTTLITVDSAIQDLPRFAQSNKTTYRVLREFNPWIRRYNLPNKSGKTYIFALPQRGMLRVDTLYQSLPETDHFYRDTLKIQKLH